MFFSRVQIVENIQNNSQLGRLLSDQTYGSHRLLRELFTDSTKFLFREEQSREQLSTRHNRPVFYVLSNAIPKDSNPLFKCETKPFNPTLSEGVQLEFKLRANPLIAIKDGGKKNSKKHDVIMHGQRVWLLSECERRGLSVEGSKKELISRLKAHKDHASRGMKFDASLEAVRTESGQQWLKSRAEKRGFNVLALQTTGYRWNALPEKGRSAGYSSLDYEGILQVTDADLFNAVLKEGLGASRSFGCGLMMTMPAR